MLRTLRCQALGAVQAVLPCTFSIQPHSQECVRAPCNFYLDGSRRQPVCSQMPLHSCECCCLEHPLLLAHSASHICLLVCLYLHWLSCRYCAPASGSTDSRLHCGTAAYSRSILLLAHLRCS